VTWIGGEHRAGIDVVVTVIDWLLSRTPVTITAQFRTLTVEPGGYLELTARQAVVEPSPVLVLGVIAIRTLRTLN
jgi:hypothetical protein